MGKSVEIREDPANSAAARGGYGALATADAETKLAEVLAGVVHRERVPVDSNFFDDLGADSLVMAHFCARVRKRADLPPVSMKDIYRYPTIKSLATALGSVPAATVEPSAPAVVEVAPAASGRSYILCGAAQLLIFLVYSALTALVAFRGYEWVAATPDVIDVYARSVLAGSAAFVGMCVLPILAKWLLVGRWTPRQIQIWSPAYLRFWIVKTLVRANPMRLFAGSPLYVLYLRALGAKVGRNVAIFSRNTPACPDLLTIGDGTVIRKDSSFNCYRAHAGLIQTGRVALGKNVVVGEATVLDIETSLGDAAQLGHASALHTGQAVPAGERWHGSPAQPADVDYRKVGPADCGPLRKTLYCAAQLAGVLLLSLPLMISGLHVLFTEVPQFAALVTAAHVSFTSWMFYVDALMSSFVILLGGLILAVVAAFTVPRVASLVVKRDTVYRLYGVHYVAHRMVARWTNNPFLTQLFGDSSYIVGYLRHLGYDLSQVEQTGSNFGMAVKHDNPYLSSFGSGTMVADGLSVINADYSSTSFRVSQATIGAHNFLGNQIVYPAQGRTGENCLLATKVMVPVDGEVREGVGLLGSPSFEIPRSVERDSRFDELKSGDGFRRRLAAKNRHNIATMGLYLLVRWMYLFGLTLLVSGAAEVHGLTGGLLIALLPALLLLFSVVFFVVVERALTMVHPTTPLYCSIYDSHFWERERYWKVTVAAYFAAFSGTPFKNMIWRLVGVRIGSRVFDDGCYLSERTLVSIGDHATLNAGSIVQCHSQEDGTFKSDRTAIGAGCTLGVGTLVHYGVTMGDGAVLASDSFLMKGEDVPAHARWGGNPARTMRSFVQDGANT